MRRRKVTPPGIQQSVFDKSRRRCALCIHFDNDWTRKDGQLAHLDRNPANFAEDNLAYLCLRHHDDYDTTRRQTKNLTIGEAKTARNRLYAFVAEGGDFTKGLPQENRGLAADRRTLNDILRHMDRHSLIFIKHPNYAGCSFSYLAVQGFATLILERNQPHQEFVDTELEALRGQFIEDGRRYFASVQTLTERVRGQEGWFALPTELRHTSSDKFLEYAQILDGMAMKTFGAYEALVRRARQKLEE